MCIDARSWEAYAASFASCFSLVITSSMTSSTTQSNASLCFWWFHTTILGASNSALMMARMSCGGEEVRECRALIHCKVHLDAEHRTSVRILCMLETEEALAYLSRVVAGRTPCTQWDQRPRSLWGRATEGLSSVMRIM